MLYTRPHFREYIMARLVSMALFVFIVFSLLLIIFIENNVDAYMAIVLLGLAFILFVFTIHKGAKRMQKELTTINTYLQNIDTVKRLIIKHGFLPKNLKISIKTL